MTARKWLKNQIIENEALTLPYTMKDIDTKRDVSTDTSYYKNKWDYEKAQEAVVSKTKSLLSSEEWDLLMSYALASVSAHINGQLIYLSERLGYDGDFPVD